MKTACLLGALALFGLQACSSSGNNNNGIDPVTDTDNNQQATDPEAGGDSNGGSESGGGETTVTGNVTTIDLPTSLTGAARGFRFDYTMPAIAGGETEARALLFEPLGDAPADGYALVVWAHGTTGIANACTPSASFNNLVNAEAINALLLEGYAVLAPDYEGFGTPDIHPYYLRASHATAVLFAVPAAHEVEGTTLSDDWAIVGHSQGGHVALSSARANGNPAYPLQAVVALAPGTDLMALSEHAFDAIDLATARGDLGEAAERTFYLNVYGAYVAHAMQRVLPEFDPQSLFGDDVGPLIDLALDEPGCGNYASQVNMTLDLHLASGATLAEFGGLRRDWHQNAVIADRVVEEEFADEFQPSPLLIVQGDADRQVPIAATTAFVDQQRSLGTDVTFDVIEGGRHGIVARDEFGRTLDWLATRFPAR